MSARGSHSLHKCRILRSWKSYNRPRLRLPKPCSVPRLDFFKNTLESKVLRFQQVHRLRRKALVEVLCGLAQRPPQYGSGDVNLLGRLSNQLNCFADELQSSDLLQCLEAFACIQYADTALMTTALGTLQDTLLTRATPRRVARLIHVCSALRFCSNKAAKTLLKALASCLNDMDWQEIVMCLEAIRNGFGCHIHNSARNVSQPLWMVLELLVYRTQLLMVYGTEHNSHGLLGERATEDFRYPEWRVGEVAYCVAPLRPLLVRQLFKTLLRCSPDADQHAVLTKEPNALLEMLADGPMNFDSASHNVEGILRQITTQQLVYLVGACQYTIMPKALRSDLKSLLLRRLSYIQEKSVVHDTRCLLSDFLFHLERARICYHHDVLRMSLGVFNAAFSRPSSASTGLPVALHALAVLSPGKYRQVVNLFRVPALKCEIPRYTAEQLMLVLHSVCLAAYRFYRGQRSSRVLCPLLPVVVPVLDCLQLVHRQLTLGQRRTTQLCLAYLYFHLPRSFTGLQALHLARLIAGFPPSAKLSSSRSGVLEATVRRKKTVATHSKSSTTESVLSAKRQVPESTKMGRVHQIQRQCRESLSVTHESFRVTSKLSALPFYPRELPLQHYDVVQVGPLCVFRLRHEENPACIVAEETQDFQVDQRFEALPQCWAMRKQDVLFHAGRRFGRLVPTEASTLRKPVYLTFSCPNDFAPPTWAPTTEDIEESSQCIPERVTQLHVARAFELYTLRYLLRLRHSQSLSIRRRRKAKKRRRGFYTLKHICVNVFRQNHVGATPPPAPAKHDRMAHRGEARTNFFEKRSV